MEKERFINRLKEFLPYNCNINVVNRKSRLVSVKKKMFSTEVNIHSVFLKSDDSIISDIIEFILNRSKDRVRESKKRISDFFEKNYTLKSFALRTSYIHRDINSMFNEIIAELKSIYKEVNFDKLNITWGKNSKQRRVSIRFGSYDKKRYLIRIHPTLDNPDVPEYFIKSVIYHEIAHFISYSISDKNSPHGKAFYLILKQFDPDFQKSRTWEKSNKMMFFN